MINRILIFLLLLCSLSASAQLTPVQDTVPPSGSLPFVPTYRYKAINGKRVPYIFYPFLNKYDAVPTWSQLMGSSQLDQKYQPLAPLTLYVGPTKQYQTIQSAIDAAPVTGANILVDNGAYSGFNIPATKTNIYIKGASRALYNRYSKTWGSGVLTIGTSFVYGNYATVENVGFSVVSGVGTGLTINSSQGNTALLNCDFSGYNYTSSEHNVLIDGGNNVRVYNCNFYNGFHGLAIKVSHVIVNGCYFYGHSQDNIIARSDNDPSGVGNHPFIEDIKITNSVIECPSDLSSTSYGIILDSQAGTSTLLSGVVISNVSFKKLLIGLATAGKLSTIDSKPYRIRNITLSNLSIDSCSAGINLFGANGVSIVGFASSNNKFSVQNFNSLHVFMDATSTSSRDSIKYTGAIEGFYTDTVARGGYATAAPQSRFQFFNSDSRGDTLTLYAGQRANGAGAALDFRMSTPDGVANSIIARFKASAFNGGSINGMGLWIGGWNTHNTATLWTFWNQTGLLDHYGTIRIRGGNPQSARILQSIDNSGLSQWVDFSSYLTNENLQSITDRGSTTTNNITIGNANQDADRFMNVNGAGSSRKFGYAFNGNIEVYHQTGANVGDLVIAPLSSNANVLGKLSSYNFLNYRYDLTTAPTPTSAGAKADIWFDASNLYVWTGTNTVKSIPYSNGTSAILNQNSTTQSGSFKISGTGQAQGFIIGANSSLTRQTLLMNDGSTGAIANASNVFYNGTGVLTYVTPTTLNNNDLVYKGYTDATYSQIPNNFRNNASTFTLPLTNLTNYGTFYGSTATWTLGTVAAGSNVTYYIKNAGSGVLTINSAAGGNDIYYTSAVATISIAAGNAIIIHNDGVNWQVE